MLTHRQRAVILHDQLTGKGYFAQIDLISDAFEACADAQDVQNHECVDAMKAGIAERIAGLEAEIDRLKRGDFTPEEFQNLCHNLHCKGGVFTRKEFAAGCLQYQDRLFGPETRST